MKIVVISDTHIPRVAHDIPPQIYSDIETCDAIINAGDFVEEALLDKLNILRKTYAVCGNMDTDNLRRRLKQKEVIKFGKFKVGIIHGYGAPRDIEETVMKEFTEVDAIVFGHSHSATNVLKSGILLFNPGSPTDKIFAKSNSYGILEISDKIEGRIINL